MKKRGMIKYQSDKYRYEKSLQLKSCKLFLGGADDRNRTCTSEIPEPNGYIAYVKELFSFAYAIF